MPKDIKEKLFKYLLIFKSVVELGSISEAARKNGVTQPSITYIIHNLENELNCELFIRRKQSLQLTSRGKSLYKQVKQLISNFDNIKKNIYLSNNEKYNGEISIATTQSFAENKLIKLIHGFRNINPSTYFSILCGIDSKSIISSVVKSEVDFGITSLSWIPKSVNINFLFKTRIILIAPKKYIFNSESNGKILDLHDLEGVPFLSRQHSVIVQQYIDKYINSRNINLNTVVKISNYTSIKKYVQNGIGCAIVEDFEQDNNNQYNIYTLPYDSDGSSYYIIRGNKKYIPSQSTAFIDYIMS